MKSKFFLITFILLFLLLNGKSQTATVPATGNGTSGNPYEIATLDNLYWLTQCDTAWDKHFIQTADIDATDSKNWDSGQGFSPIGNVTAFTGTYNGNEHLISNLFINRPSASQVGMFSKAETTSVITNLGLSNVNIVGRKMVGALVGSNLGLISECFSTGSVVGEQEVTGGLVGYNLFGDAVVVDCYSTCSVLAPEYVGGLVGDNFNSASIKNSYSVGAVTDNGAGTSYIGGFVGKNVGSDSITNSYWNIETSGQATSGGGTGLTTAQMQDQANYTSWDFTTVWSLTNSCMGAGFPYLQWQTNITLIGSGTEADPYQISSLCDLKWLSENSSVWDKYFIQTADIDATATNTWNVGDHDNDAGTPDEPMGYSPIGKSPNYFSGNYDGQGHTIDSLFINRPEEYQLGLFGVDNGSEISNVKLTNISFTGDSYVGGIGGEIEGNITNCSVTGEVNGLWYSAGIVGEFYGTATNCFADVNVTGEDQNGGFAGDLEDATVLNCYSTGNVTSGTQTGGFVGYITSSQVSNSYCSGSVSGSQVGGFIGESSGGCTITNCYTSSPVTSIDVIDGFLAYAESSITINNSFYNTDNYATTTTDAIGITTAQMQTLCTYLDGTNAAWDFMIETTNGTDNIWGLNASENGGYPFLAYQGFEHTESCCGIIDITAPETPTLADITGECSATAIAPTTEDNCNGTITGTTTDSLTYATQGTHTITWNFDDGNGNDIDVTQNVVINDVTNPTFTCIGNQEVNANSNHVYIVNGTEFDPTNIADNCGVASTLNDYNSTSTLANEQLPEGMHLITWTTTDNNGNSVDCSFTITVNQYTGIADLSANGISLYPNPTTGIFRLANVPALGNIKITDVTGKIIQSFTDLQIDKFTNLEINISNQPAGIYFIKIQTNEDVYTGKIIKQ